MEYYGGFEKIVGRRGRTRRASCSLRCYTYRLATGFDPRTLGFPPFAKAVDISSTTTLLAHVLRNILPSTNEADIINEERTPRCLTGEPDRQRLRAAAHTIGRASTVLERIRSALIIIREILVAARGDVDQLSAVEVDLQRASPLGIPRVHLRLGVEGEGVRDVFAEVGDGLPDVGGTVSAGPVDGAVDHGQKPGDTRGQWDSGAVGG